MLAVAHRKAYVVITHDLCIVNTHTTIEPSIFQQFSNAISIDVFR